MTYYTIHYDDHTIIIQTERVLKVEGLFFKIELGKEAYGKIVPDKLSYHLTPFTGHSTQSEFVVGEARLLGMCGHARPHNRLRGPISAASTDLAAGLSKRK